MHNTFSNEVLDKLCPFYFILDSTDCFVETGSGFNKLLPGVTKGAGFYDFFAVKDSADSITHQVNRRTVCVITKLADNLAMKVNPIPLNESTTLYVGYPVLTAGRSLKNYNLTINDLPQHDYMVEFLFMLEGMKRSMLESEQHIQSLATANKQLRQNNARFLQTEKVSLTGSWYWRFEEETAEWSEVCCQIYCLPESENRHSFSDWLSFIYPEDLPAIQQKINQAERNKTNIDFTCRIVTKCGQVKHVHQHSAYDFDAAGNAVGVFGTVKDVTDEVLASESIVAANKELERYQKAIDSSAIVSIANSKGIITHANDRFCELSKYTREELVGKDHRVINSGHHSKDFMRDMWKTIASGQIWKGEVRNRAKDGTYYWVDSVVIPFIDDTTGKPWQYISIRHDITARKLAEQKLLSVNTELEYYKKAMDAVALVSITNAQGIITHVNDLFCQKLKYSREELVGGSFMEIHSVCHTPEFLQKVWATVSSGQNWKGEVIKLAKDGTSYWFDCNLIPFMDEQGLMWQFASVSYDITDRKKAEEKILIMNTELELRVKERTKQLEQKNNELESFVYTVSHDLRSPLRMINSYATLVTEALGGKIPDTHVQMLKNIKQYSAGMNSIITDLLNLARIGSQPLVKQRVSLASIAEACVQELKNETGATKAHIVIGDLGETDGDIGLLKLALTNLISNALKYSAKVAEPQIEISRLVSGNNQVVYYVKDNGAGFNSDNASRLFKPFQRMHSKEEFEGTGVGLTIVHTIVTKHGGNIWAVSKENEGATFYFTLDENSSVQMKVV